jgi:hypothetical protein
MKECKEKGNFYFESPRWCLSRESGALGGNIKKML